MTVYEYGMFLTRIKTKKVGCVHCILFPLLDGVKINCICHKYGYKDTYKSRNYGAWRRAKPIETLLFTLEKNT